MSLFDECCVLIPVSTLEDFPSELSDVDARSLLAAWTILWHPSLLAETGQLPVWCRADSPPNVVDRRLISVPLPSLSRLPDGYRQRAADCPSCVWLSGSSREELLQQLPLANLRQGPAGGLGAGSRMIQVADFFAAGYAVLQIQVMTRRLRYTSNLDEVHLQGRVVAAAQAFVDGKGAEACEALHDVFDCLAEERDHYFSSDPHLIDLILTSRSTIDRLLEFTADDGALGRPDQAAYDPVTSDPVTSGAVTGSASKAANKKAAVLATPANLLIDVEVAKAIGELEPARTARLRESLTSGAIGWAGGGPPASDCLDAMTYSQAEAAFEQAYRDSSEALGMAPPVYGRFSGVTPSDLTSTLTRLGYCGMIPIDFAGGAGFGTEAKVILQGAGTQLEALTAKPIDAACDASFLTLGIRLGEAIDGGEIATALMAHWPGQTCDTFEDVKRVASWCVCLGRFWSLADYFRNGEHPYHHGTAAATAPNAGEWLETLVSSGAANPISGLAESFRAGVVEEQLSVVAGMRDLVTGQPGVEAGEPNQGLAAAIGAPVCSESSQPQSTLLINSVSVGCRHGVAVQGGLPRNADHLYAATWESGRARATVDIPGCGFVVIGGGTGDGSEAGLGKRLKQKLFGGPKPIAEPAHLQNEFMEVTLSPESGGVSGVFSGSTRGNRFSLRLIRAGLPDESTSMKCDRMRVTSTTASLGCIEATGTLRSEHPSDDSLLANFRLRYSLERGSRFLRIDGEIEPKATVSGDPWSDYIAARVAVASESPICRALIRDKVHRAKSRRMLSPLGIVLDEADRQTLICGEGLAFHRRVGERFVDTPIIVQGETRTRFVLHYGFDVPAPVAAARARIVPPTELTVQPRQTAAGIGWMLHASPKDVLVPRLDMLARSDGHPAALVRVIQTQAQACKAKLRFFRDVKTVALVDRPLEQLRDQSVEELEQQLATGRGDLKHQGDLVSLSLTSHGVADLLVVFVRDRKDDPN